MCDIYCRSAGLVLNQVCTIEPRDRRPEEPYGREVVVRVECAVYDPRRRATIEGHCFKATGWLFHKNASYVGIAAR